MDNSELKDKLLKSITNNIDSFVSELSKNKPLDIVLELGQYGSKHGIQNIAIIAVYPETKQYNIQFPN